LLLSELLIIERLLRFWQSAGSSFVNFSVLLPKQVIFRSFVWRQVAVAVMYAEQKFNIVDGWLRAFGGKLQKTGTFVM
jgi:hypothetical protein